MRVAFVSTFLPDRCGLATYAGRILPVIEQAAAVRRVRVPYGQSFWLRRGMPLGPGRGVDLVHVNYEYALYGQAVVPLLAACRLRGIPALVTQHAYDARSRPARYLNFWVRRLATRVVCHSPAVARREGYDHIPHGGLDNPYLADSPRGSREAPLFLHTGFVRENKRLDALLELFARRPGWRLEICGTHQSPEPSAYYRRCRALCDRTPGNVRWEERFLEEEELLRVYARADVLVLFYRPTEDRYHSGVVADALASGLPVVAPPLPGIREQIPEGCGLVLEGFDPAHLEQGLEAAMGRYRRWQERLAGLRRQFLWETVGRRYVEIYRELAGPRSRDASRRAA
ncbi:MAG: glycosyltransferase family 4 protein [Deferrisomatales bacterium]